jgi:hypothetical protein
MFEMLQDIARFSIEYLLDLSQSRSNPASVPSHSDHLTQSPILRLLPTNLLSYNSISELIPLVFNMYSIECLLYKNVNHFLRCFPIRLVGKFLKELGGMMRYIVLLQSSIEYYSHDQPLSDNLIVYRGIQQNGKMLALLYESMIGEVIVWPGFTSTSIDRDLVISRFINEDDSLLFEISLHQGDSAVAISDYSKHPYESEFLITASLGLMVDEIEWVDIGGLKIAQERLSYCISGYDFDIDDPPAPILV